MKTKAQYNQEAQARYAAAGLCRQCGKNPRSVKFKVCDSCLENTRRWGKDYRVRLRMQAFQAYGGPICFCCGETHLEFLTFDHINGGGSAHRRQIGAGDKLYRWLRDQGYPPGFRVACFNCNYALFRYGTCPHQRK